MSNTDNTRTLRPVPAPEPLTGLTGAPATIYTELVASPGTTGAELALATGLGRSTAGKALVTLEEHGLAIRTPGGHEGARRTPDRWNPAPVGACREQQTPTDEGSEPDGDGADTEATASAPEAVTTTHPSDTPQDITPDSLTEAEAADNAEDPNGGKDAEVANATATAREAEHPVVPMAAASIGQRARLAPGGLRQMVIDHLQAHPAEAFTATKISRVIEKSSGAIANALVTLTRQGISEQVTERPRTYRLAETGTSDA
ncbi:helix-turn-helix domain-containing protein [Streptomyces sp. NPDC059900]|uniref:helix-turn-helix domain-containing protein n=1 Tax=Streptomyces sp. NPDC059900 TaxID=3155816 RepID=UPI003432E719